MLLEPTRSSKLKTTPTLFRGVRFTDLGHNLVETSQPFSGVRCFGIDHAFHAKGYLDPLPNPIIPAPVMASTYVKQEFN